MEHRQVDVCVVGAGFAGLAAARLLINEAHKTVVVLEARDRVGGRVCEKTAQDGTLVSVGGTWLGQRQERMKTLVGDVGLSCYEQYIGDFADKDDPEDPLNPFDFAAENLYRKDGVNHRYKGMAVPIGEEAFAALALGFAGLSAIQALVPPATPWEAVDAHTLDSQPLGEWIASSSNVSAQDARDMMRTSFSVLFSSDPSEVSLLGSMILANGGGDDGFQYYADASYTETHLIDGGGAPEVALRLGNALGESLRKSSPVRRIVQNDAGVDVIGDDITVHAKYVIVTAPPVVAAQIQYEPPLPGDQQQLMLKMLPGAIIRFIVVYEPAVLARQRTLRFQRRAGVAVPGDARSMSQSSRRWDRDSRNPDHLRSRRERDGDVAHGCRNAQADLPHGNRFPPRRRSDVPGWLRRNRLVIGALVARRHDRPVSDRRPDVVRLRVARFRRPDPLRRNGARHALSRPHGRRSAVRRGDGEVGGEAVGRRGERRAVIIAPVFHTA
jgi:monoamine oxidase